MTHYRRRTAAGGVAVALAALLAVALLRGGTADAQQPPPTLVLEPASGPCDGVVIARASGLPADAAADFYPIIPGDVAGDVLGTVRTTRDGGISTPLQFSAQVCEIAAASRRLGGDGSVVIAVDSADSRDDLANYASTRYQTTTTLPRAGAGDDAGSFAHGRAVLMAGMLVALSGAVMRGAIRRR